MHKEEKERVVAELTEKLRRSETLIVADYRGLTMPQIDRLRTNLLDNGARFSIVKNTLTRIAAKEAGAEIREGPKDEAYGHRRYTAVDPEGHHWWFMQRLEDKR